MIDPLFIAPHKQGVVTNDDQEAMPAGALVAAENWIYDDGELKIRDGYSTFGNDVNERPTGYAQYKHVDGVNRTVKATSLGWWALSGTIWISITDLGNPLTGAVTDKQVFRIFQKSGATHLLGTNGANTMKKWNGTASTYSAVGGSPPRCRAMMVLFDRVIIGNLLSGGTISGTAVDVSAFQDFDNGWGSVFVGLIAAETPGSIVTMQENGTLVGSIYKDDAIVLAIAQSGAQSPFRFETKVAFVPGPASQHAVIAPQEGLHLVLANNGSIMRWDTSTYVSLGAKFQRHIQKVANIAKLDRSFAHYHHEKNSAWFFFPEKGSDDPTIGMVINLDNLDMWPFRLPFAVSASTLANTQTGIIIGDLTSNLGSMTQTIGEWGGSNAIRRTLVGETGGQTYEQLGDTDGGVNIPFYMQTGRHSLGSGARYKTINKIQHRFNRSAGSQEISVQIGVSNHGEDEVLSPAKTIDIGNKGPYETGHRVDGKFLSLRYSGQARKSIVYRGAFPDVRQRGQR